MAFIVSLAFRMLFYLAWLAGMKWRVDSTTLEKIASVASSSNEWSAS